MGWKPKEKLLSPEEAVKLAREELAPYWLASRPLIAGVRTAEGKASVHPLDGSFEKRSWLLLFADLTELRGDSLLVHLREWVKRYSSHDLGFLLIVRPTYSFLSSVTHLQPLLQRTSETYPVVIDREGLLAEAFGCQASIPCTRLLTQRKILFGCDGKDWTIRTEAEIQKFLRLQDPGLPLFPPYVPASGLPQDESAAEFGARGRAPSLLVSGKPLQDPERIIIASPEIIVRFSSPSPRVSIIAQSANPRETTKMRVELAGDTVFDAAAGADLVFGDDGGSEIKIGEPRLYHLLQNLPSKTREVTLRFPDALRTPLALYGVRFGN